ncbi:hypothetical protein TcasGA2_TC008949 [Tribolium castaneum]|uniref:Uncharacterized protein n=1 Tax=Tribolium castaneum TaxID=7070 RepID=D6WQ99_TRICA|nr:hypothetical protein TcasGA2_TC008949 [Tribolium castaneum]
MNDIQFELDPEYRRKIFYPPVRRELTLLRLILVLFAVVKLTSIYVFIGRQRRNKRANVLLIEPAEQVVQLKAQLLKKVGTKLDMGWYRALIFSNCQREILIDELKSIRLWPPT